MLQSLFTHARQTFERGEQLGDPQASTSQEQEQEQDSEGSEVSALHYPLANWPVKPRPRGRDFTCGVQAAK